MAAIPDKLAIITDEISLTYRALDLKAGRVAAVLTSLPYPTTGLSYSSSRTRRLESEMLGALKAGRIFIPVMPNSPEKWIAQVIEDSETAQIIVDRSTRSTAERATTGRRHFIEIDEFAQSMGPCVTDRTRLSG